MDEFKLSEKEKISVFAALRTLDPTLPDDASTQNIQEIVITAIERNRELNQTERTALQAALSILKCAGDWKASGSLSVPFVCPFTKVELVTLCGLSKCQYHLDYPWANNCLIAYSHQQESNQISLEEASYLLHRPVEQLYKVYWAGLYQLQRMTISEALHHNTPRYTYLQTEELCCVCESSIYAEENETKGWYSEKGFHAGKLPDTLRVAHLGLAYCSKECKEAKSQKIIELELLFAAHVQDVVGYAVKHLRSIRQVEHILGIPRWVLRQVAKKWFDKELEELFPPTQKPPPRRNFLPRRSWQEPTGVESILAESYKYSRKLYYEKGHPKVSFKAIRREITYILRNL